MSDRQVFEVETYCSSLYRRCRCTNWQNHVAAPQLNSALTFSTVGSLHCAYAKSYWWTSLLVFYALATSKVISRQVPAYYRAHSWQLYSADPLGNQAADTMTWYPTLTLSWYCANFVCMLFYILATSKVRSRHVPTCDNVHQWQLYSAAQLGNQPDIPLSHIILILSQPVFALS